MKQGWRAYLVLGFVFAFGLAIIAKLFFIQVIKGDYYKALAMGQQVGNSLNIEDRGKIFFKNGENLAINKDFSLVCADTQKVKDKEKTAETLSGILSLDKEYVLTSLQETGSCYPIKKKLSDEEVKKIKDEKLEGIYIKEEFGRYYPQEDFASQIVGFLNEEGQAQYGIEEYYDKYLTPSTKGKGSDLVLTVDYSIQFEAEKLLKEAKENLNFTEGQIIVMDPYSGKILAMANYPNFNPNLFSEVGDLGVFQNGTTQKIYEPGSVFKPITMAAGLEEKKITPQTTYVDEGMVKIGGYIIKNFDNRTYGKRTMTEVLERSINTGVVFVEKLLAHNVFLDYIEKFGIFEATGVDLKETFSQNKELKNGREINFATASFGQGLEMTPLQLIRAYCAIANGGKLVKPYIVDKIISGKGDPIETKPEYSQQIISNQTASQLTTMLVSVTENGFGKKAKIPGYYVAGKTGTAQVSNSALGIQKPGYSDETTQTFLGFAPAFEPKFVVLVKLNSPEASTAEYSALPVFRQMAEYIINYMQIPPDYEPDK